MLSKASSVSGLLLSTGFVNALPFSAMEFRLLGGGGHFHLGRDWGLVAFSMRVVRIQASGSVGLDRILLVGEMDIKTFRIALAGEQQVVMGVRVRVDEELFSIIPCLDVGAGDMNSIRIFPRNGQERIPEGRDMMFDVVHIPQV